MSFYHQRIEVVKSINSQYKNEVMLACAVRGFHYYRKKWNQSLQKHLISKIIYSTVLQ